MAADKGSGAGGSASAEIGKYLDILARDPNSRVFAPLAEAYRKAGLLDDAIETAREGLSVHPNYLGGRVALGRALFEKKRFGEAAEEMRKVAKAAPDNIIAHKVLGQIAIAQGSLPDAEKSFRMVVLLDPHDKEAKQALADIGGGTAAVSAAATTATTSAPAVPPVAAAVPPPAEEKSWGEVSLDGGAPVLKDIERHQAPTGTAAPAPLPDIDIPPAIFAAPPELDLPELPAFETQEPPPIERDEPLPAEFAAIELPELSELPTRAEPEPEATAEIEIFGREPAGLSMSATAADVAATPTETPVTGTPAEEESPFEIFGRAKRGGPPGSAKGEREAYAEIEIEPTGHAAVAGEPDADQESIFEIFTRDPRVGGGAAPRPGRGEGSSFEQIDVEPTAYVPPEHQEGEPPVIELREEIPRIDVQSELELALEMERASAAVELPAGGEEIGWEEESPWQAESAAAADDAAPLQTPEEAATEELVWEAAPAPTDRVAEVAEVAEAGAGVAEQPLEPVGETILEIAAEPVADAFADAVPEPVTAAAVEPVGDVGGEGANSAWVPPAEEILTLEEEIPSVDLAGEVLQEPAPEAAVDDAEAAAGEDAFADFGIAGAEPAPGLEPEPEPEAEPEPETEPAAGRGVFDTETLASIYINQGFYGRAAAIYERLAGASPEDAGLRRRLEEVRGLERAHAGAAAAGGAEPETTTPAGRDRAETIRRLEALLAAFRGVRPR